MHVSLLIVFLAFFSTTAATASPTLTLILTRITRLLHQRPLKETPPHVAGLVQGVPSETVPTVTVTQGRTGAHLLTADALLLLVGVHQLLVSLSLPTFTSIYIYKVKQQPTPSQVLGVFGLSIRTQERDLEDEFNRYGRVEKVTIVYDQRVSPST